MSSLQFQVSLLRSHSCRPPGCLWQATQPAPAGMCSGLRFPVSGLPRSLPLISLFGLPLAGYPASACWHVFRSQVSSFRFASFAPAHLALRAAFGRLPSQRPLACVPVSGFRFQIPLSPLFIGKKIGNWHIDYQ